MIQRIDVHLREWQRRLMLARRQFAVSIHVDTLERQNMRGRPPAKSRTTFFQTCIERLMRRKTSGRIKKKTRTKARVSQQIFGGLDSTERKKISALATPWLTMAASANRKMQKKLRRLRNDLIDLYWSADSAGPRPNNFCTQGPEARGGPVRPPPGYRGEHRGEGGARSREGGPKGGVRSRICSARVVS